MNQAKSCDLTLILLFFSECLECLTTIAVPYAYQTISQSVSLKHEVIWFGVLGIDLNIYDQGFWMITNCMQVMNMYLYVLYCKNVLWA